MITGFNTDIEYEGVTYHVQTEDKGLETPLILSLVYDRGTILASKRSPYNDLLEGSLDEGVLYARLQKQHKLICAAISAGRIEELKQMTLRDSAAKKKNSAAEIESHKAVSKESSVNKENKEAKTPVKDKEKFHAGIPKPEIKPAFLEQSRPVQKIAERIDKAKAEAEKSALKKTPVTRSLNVEGLAVKPAESLSLENPLPSIPKPKHELGLDLSIKTFEEEPIIEAVEIIEDELILPAEAVEIVTDFNKPETPEAGKLKIEFLAETPFKGGDRKTVSFLVCRGKTENGIGGAQIMVKVLGSSFRPLIFHAKTDNNGVATIHLQLPHFRTGRAALLVRALNAGEQVELRRVILHG